MIQLDHCYLGDCRASMRQMLEEGGAGKVQTIITSPPYWGLRDYGVAGQLGQEPTLREFLANMVEVFDLCRELLSEDGTLWMNMGDSYLFLLTKSERYHFDQEAILEPVSPNTHARLAQDVQNQVGSSRANGGAKTNGNMKAVGRKQNIPAGWATGTDRKHDELEGRYSSKRKAAPEGSGTKNNASFDAAMAIMPAMRNKRSVWTIPTESYSEAHFATFPQALVEPCILAGSRPGDIVFDPFLGSGTVAQVAQRLGRHWVGCELNPEYLELQRDRTRQRGLVLETA